MLKTTNNKQKETFVFKNNLPRAKTKTNVIIAILLVLHVMAMDKITACLAIVAAFY